MKKSNIVTAITVFRMSLVLLLPAMLLFTAIESKALCVPFWILYFLGGISDVADGFLARRWQVQSERGAKLDSRADLLFILGTIIYLLLAAVMGNFPASASLMFILWIGIGVAVIAIIRFISMAVCEERFGQFTGIHTIANKVAGVMLFFTVPIGLTLYYMDRLGECIFIIWTVIVWVICGYASVEEMILVFKMKTLDVNRKSIFCKSKTE